MGVNMNLDYGIDQADFDLMNEKFKSGITK